MREAFHEVMRRAKQQVMECSPAQVNAALAHRHGTEQDDQDFVLVDIREKLEWNEGYISGAIHVPRGHLEMKIEEAIPDKSKKVILYCAGGVRSLVAGTTLQQMGYEDVLSMSGGFSLWKDSGYSVIQPRMLTEAQAKRYGRHVLIPEVGEAGQLKLLASRVLLIGAGALSSPAALYLAVAGVGTLSIIDADVVDESNVPRQIIHHTERMGEYKAELAHAAIAALNPDVKVNTSLERLDETNVQKLVDEYHVIVDGTDNFTTRSLLNDAAVRAKKPVVHGSVSRFEGKVTVFKPYDGPCYRCLYPEPPPALAPSSAEAGVLGVLPGVIALLLATETIKLLLGIGAPLVGRLLTYDALAGGCNEVHLFRDPNCLVCGEHAHLEDLPKENRRPARDESGIEDASHR